MRCLGRPAKGAPASRAARPARKQPDEIGAMACSEVVLQVQTSELKDVLTGALAAQAIIRLALHTELRVQVLVHLLNQRPDRRSLATLNRDILPIVFIDDLDRRLALAAHVSI